MKKHQGPGQHIARGRLARGAPARLGRKTASSSSHPAGRAPHGSEKRTGDTPGGTLAAAIAAGQNLTSGRARASRAVAARASRGGRRPASFPRPPVPLERVLCPAFWPPRRRDRSAAPQRRVWRIGTRGGPPLTGIAPGTPITRSGPEMPATRDIEGSRASPRNSESALTRRPFATRLPEELTAFFRTCSGARCFLRQPSRTAPFPIRSAALRGDC